MQAHDGLMPPKCTTPHFPYATGVPQWKSGAQETTVRVGFHVQISYSHSYHTIQSAIFFMTAFHTLSIPHFRFVVYRHSLLRQKRVGSIVGVERTNY